MTDDALPDKPLPDDTSPDSALQIGELAELTGVTVRTLHHYDRIGLLRPSHRSSAGYRRYAAADVRRLQQIVVYRRLELPLAEIAALLDGPDGPVVHLTRQRDAAAARIGELRDLLTTLDTLLEAEMNNRPATTDEIREVFGDGFSDDYATQARERWGGTAAWQQSAARTARYTKSDWTQLKAEQDANIATFADVFRSGSPADSPAATAAAEQARLLIHERFYDCPPEFHCHLADMYVADPRFAATYDDAAPGLAVFVREAIYANAARTGGEQ